MPVIYVNQKGRAIRNYSLSQADSSAFCPHKFAQERIIGLQQRKTSANLPFGRAVESGLRHFHQTGMDPVPAVADLMRKELAQFKDLDFKAKWATPETLTAAAQNCMRLYKARKDDVGIVNPTFYTYEERVVKDNFLEDSGFELVPDVIDWPAPHQRFGDGARIIDIKCIADRVSQKYEGIAALDKQLNVYAHFTGIYRVALLAFTFGSPDPPDLGKYRVCMTDIKGTDGVILRAGTTVRHSDALPGHAEELNKKARAEAKKMGAVWVSAPGLERPVTVHLSALANVGMQLIEGRVDPWAAASTVELLRNQARLDAERWAGYSKAIADLESAKDKYTYEEYSLLKKNFLVKFYPRNPGIRFPDTKCTWCHLVGECLDRPDISNELVTIQDERWLEELE